MSRNLDDLIDEWHQSDSELSLAEYLGMTDEEYMDWVEADVEKENR